MHLAKARVKIILGLIERWGVFRLGHVAGQEWKLNLHKYSGRQQTWTRPLTAQLEKDIRGWAEKTKRRVYNMVFLATCM